MLSHSMTVEPILAKFSQARLCNLVVCWIERYPGDVASQSTAELLAHFLYEISPLNWLTQYAVELKSLLDTIVVGADPEASWALPDMVDVPGRAEVACSPSVVGSFESGLYTGLSITSSFTPQTITPTTPSFGSGNDHSISRPLLEPVSTVVGHPVEQAINRPRSQSDADAATQASSEGSGSLHSGNTAQHRFAAQRRSLAIQEASNLILDIDVKALAQHITNVAWDLFAKLEVWENSIRAKRHCRR